MLQEIRLLNCQLHSSLILTLFPGLNVIIGETDRGKSAVVRGLKWLALHETTGNDLLRFGENTLKVGVKTPFGAVLRYKDARESGYKLGGEWFKACKTEQPKAVSDLLMLTETNFQSQHDPMFLVGVSPGIRAKEINKLVSLEDIDKANTWLKTKGARLTTLIQAAEDKIALCEKNLAEFEDLDQKLALLMKLKTSISQIDATKRAMSDMRSLIQAIKNQEAAIAAIGNRIAVMSKIISLGADLIDAQADRSRLESFLVEYRESKTIPRIVAFGEKLDDLIEAKDRQFRLDVLVQEWRRNEFEISQQKDKISALVAFGRDILQAMTKKQESLRNIIELLKAIKSEYADAQAKSSEIAEQIAVLEKPQICSQCGKCMIVCPKC